MFWRPPEFGGPICSRIYRAQVAQCQAIRPALRSRPYYAKMNSQQVHLQASKILSPLVETKGHNQVQAEGQIPQGGRTIYRAYLIGPYRQTRATIHARPRSQSSLYSPNKRIFVGPYRPNEGNCRENLKYSPSKIGGFILVYRWIITQDDDVLSPFPYETCVGRSPSGPTTKAGGRKQAKACSQRCRIQPRKK